MKTHSDKFRYTKKTARNLIDILFESDLQKILEFTKGCAVEDAQRSWSYVEGFDGDIDLELEAQHGVLEYHKMFRPVRPYGDLYEGERETYIKAFKEAWNNCKVQRNE